MIASDLSWQQCVFADGLARLHSTSGSLQRFIQAGRVAGADMAHECRHTRPLREAHDGWNPERSVAGGVSGFGGYRAKEGKGK